MFVRCPDCLTQFRVRAWHLTAAGGRVRCGACGHAFDAVSRLSDEPRAVAPETETAGSETVISDDGDLNEFDLPQGLYGGDEPGDDAWPGSAGVAGDWPDMEPEQAAPKRTGRWLFVAALLILLGLGQAAWFHRNYVYQHWPQALPRVQQLCEHIGCQVHRLRQPAAIELLNRDVRQHPVYEDTLLVNATITNRADSRQPYPRIQFALYGTDGKALAYREFAPTDYLDDSLPVSAGMPADTPIHVVFEVASTTEGAVSYEFGFK